MPVVPIEKNRVGIADVSGEKLQAADLSGTGLQALGQGLQQLGNAGGQFAEALAHREEQLDNTGAKTLDVEAMGRLAAIRNEYLSTRGLNAATGRAEAEKAIRAAREEFLGRATTPRMKRMLSQVLDQRVQATADSFDQHSRTQMTAAEDGASEARWGASAEMAVSAVNPDDRARNIDTGLGEIEEWGKRRGFDPSVIAGQKLKYTSGIHTSIARDMIDADNVDGAIAYREKHKAEIGADDESRLDAMLRAPLQRREVNGDADAVMGHATRDAPSSFSYADPLHGIGKAPVSGGTYGASRDYGAHKGVDIPAPIGTAIYSTAPGVASVSHSEKGGTIITVDHGNGSKSRYMHVGKVRIEDGDTVTPDTIIGTVGMTGRSTGPHVHFEVIRNGVAVNPDIMIGKPGQQQAPRRHDLNQLLAATDAQADREQWSPERRDRAKQEVERRVSRDEQLLARQESEAQRRALDHIAEMPEGSFTSLAQLPADVRASLTPTQRRDFEDMAKRNTIPKAVAPNGDYAIVFNRMAAEDKEQFLSTDLRMYRDRISPAEFDTLFTLQGRLRANPQAPEAISHDKLWTMIGRYGGQIGVDSSKDAPPAKAQAAQRIFSMMQADLRAVTEGKRQPTDDEAKAAFDRAVMEVRVKTPGAGLFGGDVKTTARRFEVRGPAQDVPATVRARIAASLRRNSRQPTEGAIAEVYRRHLGERGFW